MTPENIENIKSTYSRLKNLKLTSKEINIPWQTVYWWLKREGIEVTGDKARYGGKTDRIGIIGESLFAASCNKAINQNILKFQADCDFIIGNTKIDIKTSFLQTYMSRGRPENLCYRWAFNPNYKSDIDYMVCYCLEGDVDNYKVQNILLIPQEVIYGKQTVSVSKIKSKYFDFKISEEELIEFFDKF